MAEVGRIQIEVDARQVDKATRALNDLGLKAQATGRKVSGFESKTDKATKATDKMSMSSRKLTRMFGLLSAGIGGLTFVGLATQIERATTQLNNIEATMRVAAGSSEAAGQQIAFIREESERLGLFFPTVAKQMAQFSAAARGTSITSEELKMIFTGISEASRAMGLTAPEAEGAMKALQQMMSKGKVSAEELRQQLGERMPGSIQIMARSLGVGTQELFKMMENGELLSDEVLPKFARELSKTFSGEASQQAERIAASIQRLQTAFFNLMSQGDLSGASQAINDLANTISNPDFQNSFDKIIKGLSDLLGAAARNIDALIQLTKLLGILVSIRVAKWAAATVGGLNGIRTAASFLAGPAGMLALVATGLFKLGSKAETTEKFLLDLGEAGSTAKEGMSELNTEVEKGILSTLDKLLMKGESFLLGNADSALDSMFPDDVSKLKAVNEEIAALQQRIPEGGEASRYIERTLEDLREERQALLQAIALSEIQTIEDSGFYNPKRGRDRLSAAQKEAKAVKQLVEAQKEAIEILSKYDPLTAAALEYRDSLVELNTVFESGNLSAERHAALISDAEQKYRQAKREAEGLTGAEKAALDVLAQYDEELEKGLEQREKIQELTRAYEDLGVSSEKAAQLAAQVIDKNTLTDFQQGVKDIADAIENDLSNSLTNVLMDVESLTDAFVNLADQIARSIIQQQIADPLVEGITDFATSAARSFFAPGNPNATVAQGGSAAPPPSIRKNANGGNVYGDTPSIVGERGPELFVPGQDGRIIPNHDMRSGGGDVTVNIINQGGEKLESEQQQSRRGPDGEMTVDVMVRSSIERLDGQGQLDGVFRRHGAARQGQF